METGIIGLSTSNITRTSALKQADEAREFSKTLETLQTRLSGFGKSKIKGKTLSEGVQDLGIMGYVKEARLDELRKQIRDRVMHDLRITEKQYQALRGGIRKLHANSCLPQDNIDRLVTMSDDLEDAITAEVERRLKEHLAAEAGAGMLITNTLAYNPNSRECQKALTKLREMLDDVVKRYRELKALEEKGDLETP